MTATADMAHQLSDVPLFSGFSGRALQRVARSGRVIDHPPGKEVTAEGGNAVGFHLVLDGRAVVDVHGNPRPDLVPGDYFGEISLLDGKPRTATVRAGDDGLRTFSLTSWDFRAVLDDHPELARTLLTTLCARLRAAEASTAG